MGCGGSTGVWDPLGDGDTLGSPPFLSEQDRLEMWPLRFDEMWYLTRTQVQPLSWAGSERGHGGGSRRTDTTEPHCCHSHPWASPGPSNGDLRTHGLLPAPSSRTAGRAGARLPRPPVPCTARDGEGGRTSQSRVGRQTRTGGIC